MAVHDGYIPSTACRRAVDTRRCTVRGVGLTLGLRGTSRATAHPDCRGQPRVVRRELLQSNAEQGRRVGCCSDSSPSATQTLFMAAGCQASVLMSPDSSLLKHSLPLFEDIVAFAGTSSDAGPPAVAYRRMDGGARLPPPPPFTAYQQSCSGPRRRTRTGPPCRSVDQNTFLRTVTGHSIRAVADEVGHVAATNGGRVPMHSCLRSLVNIRVRDVVRVTRRVIVRTRTRSLARRRHRLTIDFRRRESIVSKRTSKDSVEFSASTSVVSCSSSIQN